MFGTSRSCKTVSGYCLAARYIIRTSLLAFQLLESTCYSAQKVRLIFSFLLKGQRVVSFLPQGQLVFVSLSLQCQPFAYSSLLFLSGASLLSLPTPFHSGCSYDILCSGHSAWICRFSCIKCTSKLPAAPTLLLLVVQVRIFYNQHIYSQHRNFLYCTCCISKFWK